MGLSSSCPIFEAFTTALEWLSINHLGPCAVLHILDNFLFIAQSEGQCELDLDNLILMCTYLGVPLAPEKTVGPAIVLQFDGITLDSVHQEVRLPEEKHQILCDVTKFPGPALRPPKRTPISDRFIELYMRCGCSGSSFAASHDRSYQRRQQASSSHTSFARC